ncbi:MAG: hypothetical protein QW412_03660 [Candidatus Aenigmatarchaeota archaeon]
MKQDTLEKIDKLIEENRRFKVKEVVSKLKDEGKILPVYEPLVNEILTATWDNESKVIKLSEGENEVEFSLKDAIIKLFERMPKVIELSETGVQKEESPEDKEYNEISKLAEEKGIKFELAREIWKKQKEQK